MERQGAKWKIERLADSYFGSWILDLGSNLKPEIWDLPDNAHLVGFTLERSFCRSDKSLNAPRQARDRQRTQRRLAGRPHVPPLDRLGAGNAEKGKDEQGRTHGDHLPLT